LYKSKI